MAKNGTTPKARKTNASLTKRFQELAKSFGPTIGRVHVVARDGGHWAVRKEGSNRATRVHKDKAAAVEHAKDLAKKNHQDLVIHTKSGKVESWVKSGDPLPPKE
jgi:hypothetical protein